MIHITMLGFDLALHCGPGWNFKIVEVPNPLRKLAFWRNVFSYQLNHVLFDYGYLVGLYVHLPSTTQYLLCECHVARGCTCNCG